MTDERIGAPEREVRNIWAWTELFRTFQVALDPKKLLLAATMLLVAASMALSRPAVGTDRGSPTALIVKLFGRS